MLYVIHCRDKPGSSSIRRERFEDHKAYLASAPISVVISGPLLAADNETPIGSCFIVEADSLSQVEQVNQQDPFYKAGLWNQISIHPFLKRVDNRK